MKVWLIAMMNDVGRGQVEIAIVGHFSGNQETASSGVQRKNLYIEQGETVNGILNKLNIDPDEVGLVIIDNEVVDGTYEVVPGTSIKLFPFVSGG